MRNFHMSIWIRSSIPLLRLVATISASMLLRKERSAKSAHITKSVREKSTRLESLVFLIISNDLLTNTWHGDNASDHVTHHQSIISDCTSICIILKIGYIQSFYPNSSVRKSTTIVWRRRPSITSISCWIIKTD